MNRHTPVAARRVARLATARLSSCAVVGALLAVWVLASSTPAPGWLRTSPAAFPTWPQGGTHAVHTAAATDGERSDADRLDALRRAEVWQEPAVPIERASFSDPPEGSADPLECRFVPRVPGGTTAKFDCTLADGTVVRVKYGTGPERHGEVAATRLARALGFGADHVRFVPRLRCHGCPPAPFLTMKAAGALHAGDLFERAIDYGKSNDFEWVTVEHRFPGAPIETKEVEGWGWYELEESRRVANARRRTHIDGLHLFAVFLAHWDNKAENQRLTCLDAPASASGCSRPFALVQDLGATFGPLKVDFAGWRDAAIWSDRRTCLVDMEALPFGGGTFRPLHVSDAGRQWLVQRLAKLSDRQITALFEGARFHEADGRIARPAPVASWVNVFKARVRQLAEGPACPS